MRKVIVMFAAVLAFGGLAACSSTSTQVQDQIQEQIREKTGDDTATVSCPDDIEAKKGETSVCTAKGDFSDFVKKNSGVEGDIKTLTFNITFTSDSAFEANIDTDQLAKDLGISEDGSTGETTTTAAPDDTTPDDTTPAGDDAADAQAWTDATEALNASSPDDACAVQTALEVWNGTGSPVTAEGITALNTFEVAILSVANARLASVLTPEQLQANADALTALGAIYDEETLEDGIAADQAAFGSVVEDLAAVVDANC